MKTIALPLCLLLSSLVTFPQEKVIQKTAFDEFSKTATGIFKSRPFRVTINTEVSVNGKPQENTFSKTIIEVSGDNRRYSHERKSKEKTSKNEYVQIGGKVYSRENEGQWKETAVTDRNRSERSLKLIDEQAEFKSLGAEDFNNQPALVFVKNTKFKRIDEVNGNKEILTVESIKYWFGKDGTLLKRETKRENRIGELTFHFHIISLFDYDQNIQISVP